MILHVDTSSAVPPYDQLQSQIAELIECGELAPRARLPTIRQLATDLGLAPGTVARSYRGLEDAQLIVTRGRRGTYVSESVASATAQRRFTLLAEAARSFVHEARRLGVDPTATERAFRNALIADWS